MLYLLLFIVCIWLVITRRINTDNVIKLVGIGCIAVGALIELKNKNSNLIEFGILLYFTVNIITAYFGTRKRRHYDKMNYDN